MYIKRLVRLMLVSKIIIVKSKIRRGKGGSATGIQPIYTKWDLKGKKTHTVHTFQPLFQVYIDLTAIDEGRKCGSSPNSGSELRPR